MTNQTTSPSLVAMNRARSTTLILASLLAACSSVQTPSREAPDQPTPLRVAYFVVETKDKSTANPASAATPKAPNVAVAREATAGPTASGPAQPASTAARGPLLTPAALKEAIPKARAFEETVLIQPAKSFSSETQRDLDLLVQAQRKKCDVCVVFEIAEDVKPRELEVAGEISWNSFFGGFPNLLWMNEAVFECAGRIRARTYSVASFRPGMGLPTSFESEFKVPDVVLRPDERVGGLGWWLGLALPTCWTPTDDLVVANAMRKRAPEALQQHGLRGWAHTKLLPKLDVDVQMMRKDGSPTPSKFVITPRRRLKVVGVRLQRTGQKTAEQAFNSTATVEHPIPPEFAPTTENPTQVTVFLSGPLEGELVYSFTFTR